MSTADIIQEIQRMDPRELAQLKAAYDQRVAHLSEREGKAPREAVGEPSNEIDDARFAKASEFVFTEHAELLRRLAQ